MTWALAIGGIIVLVILHEAGHFVAAKATGMRVERFFLFFPPKLFSIRRGETEYGIGSIPAGGFVKITGMNPDEELPPEIARRGYYAQPVWKRIVVIGAGPVVNVLIAFVLLFGLAFWAERPTAEVGEIVPGTPAAAHFEPGDRVLAVNGRSGEGLEERQRLALFQELIDEHDCPGEQTDGCRAAQPATVLIERGGHERELRMRPEYDAEIDRHRLGFSYGSAPLDPSLGEAVSVSADFMWFVSSQTISTFAQIFQAEEREKLGSIAGAAKVTEQAFSFDVVAALQLIAVISLSLALINLFPFLPLDGGHIFWSVVEKLRGRRVAFAVMERAGVIGFLLVIGIFFIGLSNDIERFTTGGFDQP